MQMPEFKSTAKENIEEQPDPLLKYKEHERERKRERDLKKIEEDK